MTIVARAAAPAAAARGVGANRAGAIWRGGAAPSACAAATRSAQPARRETKPTRNKHLALTNGVSPGPGRRAPGEDRADARRWQTSMGAASLDLLSGISSYPDYPGEL